ncbi:MAG: metalloregulator ArsR/SmtB family transcription factor [Lutispora sp.]|nr:metalloregulator ArsR/SmtB family transcription factor [Lutispora sp.]
MEKDFKRYAETAELLKVLAHPVRLCIVKGLVEKGACNVSHMQDCLELPQSTISQHLQKLRAAGIVMGERSGLEISYSVSDERAVSLIKTLFN